MPNLHAVKHEVKSAEAQERIHPVFDPMLEQFERFTQMIQRQHSRKILVRLPNKESVYKLRVPKVPAARINGGQLGQIKQALSKQVGKPSGEIEAEIVQRAKNYSVPYYVQPDKPFVILPEREEEMWQ
jgi:hypothetical protein